MKYNLQFSDDGGNWVPPTDAELKVIAARRERQDKVSKLLGEYLLKGYKMLGTSCTTCEVSFYVLAQCTPKLTHCVNEILYSVRNFSVLKLSA